ncbi:hypothetical protein FBQ95_16990 [Chloroflexi bacterium CFX3]|nr:hypothetical protein [Chloroflexi bacterium CFX3]
MSDFFVPDIQELPNLRQVPYFEDQEDDPKKRVQGYATQQSLAYYRDKVSAALQKLGAIATNFIPMKSAEFPLRYGYRITFVLGKIHGRIDIAALPIRAETARKKERALSQALYLLALKLDAEATAWAYEPGTMPLLPYLIGEGDRTITQAVIELGVLPQLPSGEKKAVE